MGCKPLDQIVDIGGSDFHLFVTHVEIEGGACVLILLEMLVGLVKLRLLFGLVLLHGPDLDFLLGLLGVFHMGE